MELENWRNMIVYHNRKHEGKLNVKIMKDAEWTRMEIFRFIIIFYLLLLLLIAWDFQNIDWLSKAVLCQSTLTHNPTFDIRNSKHNMTWDMTWHDKYK